MMGLVSKAKTLDGCLWAWYAKENGENHLKDEGYKLMWCIIRSMSIKKLLWGTLCEVNTWTMDIL